MMPRFLLSTSFFQAFGLAFPRGLEERLLTGTHRGDKQKSAACQALRKERPTHDNEQQRLDNPRPFNQPQLVEWDAILDSLHLNQELERMHGKGRLDSGCPQLPA